MEGSAPATIASPFFAPAHDDPSASTSPLPGDATPAALIDLGLPQAVLCRATASPTFFPGAVPAPSSRDKKHGSGRPPLRSGLTVRVVRPAA